ncbi:MAG: LPS export ABC transporter periplasmic protein LptC [Bacteroidia bacterium]|nr:LPS export ABC transporter periplasmic protein LptC [Bacteroidia bacterium]
MKILKSKIIVFFAVLVFGVTLLQSCTNDLETVNAIVDLSAKPMIFAKDVEILRTDSGKIVLKGFAKESAYYLSEKDTFLEFKKGFKIETFKDYPIVESSITAEYGKHWESKKIWEAKTNVVTQNIKGEMLNTEQLFWDENKHIIYSNSFCRVTTSDGIITGNSFEADETFNKWTLKKGKGTINVKDE